MDAAERERLIAQIMCRDILVTIRTKDHTSIPLFLHPPSPREQSQAVNAYYLEYQLCLARGLLNEDDLVNHLIEIGSWDEKTDTEITGLQSDIYNIRRGLLDLVFNKTHLEKARVILRRAESALLERLSKRYKLLTDSADAYALICQQRYLISCITEREDGSLFWKTKDDFESFDDIDVITRLSDFFFMHSHVSTNDIRELARSQQWRLYWEVAKKTNDLFDGPVTSWSWNQIELAHWSTIYDSVYDAYERPSKEVIVDDDLLDSWFIHQGEKAEGRTKATTPVKQNKPGRNEEFIMADRKGAKSVYGMNDPSSRAMIQARQKVLQRQGSVKEQDMPDSQREMRQQLMGMQKRHVKDIGRR